MGVDNIFYRRFRGRHMSKTMYLAHRMAKARIRAITRRPELGKEDLEQQDPWLRRYVIIHNAYRALELEFGIGPEVWIGRGERERGQVFAVD